MQIATVPPAKYKKNRRKFKCIACGAPLTFGSFAEKAQISLDAAVAKGNLLPFRLLCMRNPQIACNVDHVLSYR